MSSSVAKLKERVLRAESEVLRLQSMLEAFFTGDVPDGASVDHLILAKWGRKRLEEKKQQPALLQPEGA